MITVEVGGGGKLVDGGGDLRFLYGGFGGFQISLSFLLLIFLHL